MRVGPTWRFRARVETLVVPARLAGRAVFVTVATEDAHVVEADVA